MLNTKHELFIKLETRNANCKTRNMKRETQNAKHEIETNETQNNAC